jgi:hypothetical protein
MAISETMRRVLSEVVVLPQAVRVSAIDDAHPVEARPHCGAELERILSVFFGGR